MIMTIEDLKGTKIYLHFQDERIKFKNKIEKLGIRWMFINYDNPIKQDIPFIYIDEDLSLYIDYRKNFESFCASRSKQIFLEDVLSIEEPKEECKFKPFDRVLVRYDNNSRWRPREFSFHVKGEESGFIYECTDGYSYKQCLSYKENESLANTKINPNI